MEVDANEQVIVVTVHTRDDQVFRFPYKLIEKSPIKDMFEKEEEDSKPVSVPFNLLDMIVFRDYLLNPGLVSTLEMPPLTHLLNVVDFFLLDVDPILKEISSHMVLQILHCREFEYPTEPTLGTLKKMSLTSPYKY